VTHRDATLSYIEVSKDDIALANRIAHEVLGRTLDELPPQTRRLLKLIYALVRERSEREHVKPREVRFTRREVRDYTSWSDNQLKVHCLRLAELEYLLVHGGSRGHVLHYELMYDGAADDEPRLAGLIEPEELDNEERKLDPGGSKLASSCPQVVAKLDPVDSVQSQERKGEDGKVVGVGENAYIREKISRPSLARVVQVAPNNTNGGV
jgi:DNA primase